MKNLLSAAALLLAACANPAPAAMPAPPAAAPAPRFPGLLRPAPADGFELRLRRSGCYGICPSYEVVIHADGTVDFQGISHVAVKSAHGQADAAALARLRARLEQDADIPWGDYVRGSALCGDWATDMPGAAVEAWFAGRWHAIHHDYGCSAAPAALKALEQDIDTAARAARWSSGHASE